MLAPTFTVIVYSLKWLLQSWVQHPCEAGKWYHCYSAMGKRLRKKVCTDLWKEQRLNTDFLWAKLAQASFVLANIQENIYLFTSESSPFRDQLSFNLMNSYLLWSVKSSYEKMLFLDSLKSSNILRIRAIG